MRNTLHESIPGYSTDGPSICGGYLRKELPHSEKTQGAVQPAVRLRHEKRHLQQGLFRVCGFEPVQGQEPQQA